MITKNRYTLFKIFFKRSYIFFIHSPTTTFCTRDKLLQISLCPIFNCSFKRLVEIGYMKLNLHGGRPVDIQRGRGRSEKISIVGTDTPQHPALGQPIDFHIIDTDIARGTHIIQYNGTHLCYLICRNDIGSLCGLRHVAGLDIQQFKIAVVMEQYIGRIILFLLKYIRERFT